MRHGNILRSNNNENAEIGLVAMRRIITENRFTALEKRVENINS